MPLFLFILIFSSTYRTWYIHSIFIQNIHPLQLATRQLSGKNLPGGVPSMESNSGLPYSKPTQYHLGCVAPFLSYVAPYFYDL